jgi:glycosyltransferase involved in cell wall biosynthesis
MNSASVVIPTYNQSLRLKITLTSFLYQTSSAPFEIIVVDDGSTDETLAVLESFIKKLPLSIIQQSNRGRAAARNAGVLASQGELILFCDSDRPVSNNWVESHVDKHRKSQKNIICVGEILEFFFSNLEKKKQDILLDIEHNWENLSRFSRVYGYWKKLRSTFINGDCLLHAPWIATLIGNLSISRDFALDVGLLDEDFKTWGFEHFEFGYRLHEAGGIFKQNQDARNYHLSHSRETKYSDEIEKSQSLFARKNGNKNIENLSLFLGGKINLGEFDQMFSNGEKSLLPYSVQKLRYKSYF